MSQSWDKRLLDPLVDSIPRHLLQNALMGIPPVRAYARRRHSTGMGRAPEKVGPVLVSLLRMLGRAGTTLQGKSVLEIGPGQTPDLLFAALLGGARRVEGLDVNDYLDMTTVPAQDFWCSASWLSDILVREGFAVPAQMEQMLPREGPLPPDRFRISHFDGRRFPLVEGSADLVWSKSVLEHVRDPRRTLEEVKRVLRPGGLACHIIDLRDHYTFENGRDWLRFLRYSPALWELMASRRASWCNRLRASQWEGLFRDAGFEVVNWEVEARALHPDFRRDRLAAPFRGMAEEELRVAWVYAVHRTQRL